MLQPFWLKSLWQRLARFQLLTFKVANRLLGESLTAIGGHSTTVPYYPCDSKCCSTIYRVQRLPVFWILDSGCLQCDTADLDWVGNQVFEDHLTFLRTYCRCARRRGPSGTTHWQELPGQINSLQLSAGGNSRPSGIQRCSVEIPSLVGRLINS